MYTENDFHKTKVKWSIYRDYCTTRCSTPGCDSCPIPFIRGQGGRGRPVVTRPGYLIPLHHFLWPFIKCQNFTINFTGTSHVLFSYYADNKIFIHAYFHLKWIKKKKNEVKWIFYWTHRICTITKEDEIGKNTLIWMFIQIKGICYTIKFRQISHGQINSYITEVITIILIILTQY